MKMETELLKLDEGQRCSIAENLAHLIKHKKVTENEVAQDLALPVITIRRLLSGETTDPRISTLKAIANYFNVPIDTLIQTDSTSPNEFINQSKPVFIPVLDWDSAKNADKMDLTNWPSWIPVTVGKSEQISKNSFALESRPFMYPRFQQGTIFILDPTLTPTDGDLVLINLHENNELTLRELFIDPPEWQLHPINQGSSTLSYSKENHKIVAVVFLTLFYNRKMRT
jgi:transcriptional regulator with XRE-family HTH domain